MQLVGLIHDLGKLLFFLGAEGQWDVVGVSVPFPFLSMSYHIWSPHYCSNLFPLS